ncbi:MAG: hypothetical protein KBA90_14185 [Chitinophagaceae bacterium]|nr:hypothetical protein [Chitinophagaceae bacterium]
MSKEFKVKFDMKDYLDIAPKEQNRRYLEHDEVLNYREYEKGNIDNCIWQRHIPTAAEIASPDWRSLEMKRILRTGVLIAIKDEILWLPPSYYFALQYGKVGDVDLQFRLKRLKHVYFKIRARNNPGCKGTFTVKNRADGETTMAVTDALHECMDGIMFSGMIGLQSKTRADVKNPCWLSVQTTWLNLDRWVKDEMYSDFASGENIAEKLRFIREGNDSKKARNIVFEYFPAVFNAMDGRHNMKKCILDEVLKWVECNFGDTLTNYSKFIMPGFERRGLFDIFSSPADKDCQSYRDGYELWKKSDPDNLIDTGTTESRIHRYYSNPLEGIQGAYDKWGDADPQAIYGHIMRERAACSKDKLLGEIRGFPLNEEEMWGSLEGGAIWSNAAGIKERSIYLLGTRFKDEKTKEPKVLYGNLERVEGYIDGDVEFRVSDKDYFDESDAKFCITHIEQNREPLENIFKPPKYVENCLGVDPFNLRYNAKNTSKQSLGAMVNRKFRDVLQTGINKVPTLIYLNRPSHQDIFFEDVIKAAIYRRALIQYESRSDKLANYCEDRGYFDWLLPEMGASADSVRKGDAPSGKGKFLDEGIALIDAVTNTPLKEGDPYLLEMNWFYELLHGYLVFDPNDTQKGDIVMADIQALIGAVKIMHKKIRQPSDINSGVFEYLLG